VTSVLLLSTVLALGADADVALTDLSEEDLVARASAAVAAGESERASEVQARPYFGRAAACYEELQRRGVRNPLLFRNLGNAHFLAGDSPRAVLAYRRGLQLRPDDPDLLAALMTVREQVYLPPGSTLGHPPEDDSLPWMPVYPPSWLVALVAILYLLSCLVLTRWWMTRSRRILALGVFLLFQAIAPTLLIYYRAKRAAEEVAHPLIVIRATNVKLLQGNGPDYPARYDLAARPGVEGRLLFERDDWLQIELAGGEIGWVKSDKVLVDRPGT
jgi:hypothetical protein